MAINLDGANGYFAPENHSKAAVWMRYSVVQRTGAIAEAKRDLSRALKRALDENEPPFKPGDRRREEFAVYEQALWRLEGSVQADPDTGDIIATLRGRQETDDVAQGRDRSFAGIAHAAMLWLGWDGNVRLVRG